MRPRLTSIVTSIVAITAIAAAPAPGAALAAVVPPDTAASASTPPAPAHWSATWTSAMQQPTPSTDQFGQNWSEQGFAGQTVREKLRTTSAGNQIRVRLSNLDGTAPLHLTGATVAETTTGAAVAPNTMRPVTFGGHRSLILPTGRATASDAVHLPVTALEPLTVTLYFTGPTGPATFHEDGLTTTYLADGNHLHDPGAGAFGGPTSHSTYYLTGVDVTAPRPETVVSFGDSITNGHNSTVDGNARYTDVLADRIVASHVQLSVANAGITGNLLLHQLPCFGDTGVTRFQRDVLDQPGVRTAIVMEGSNDIWDSVANYGCGTTPEITADQIIDGLRSLIAAAHSRGVRVVGATILPFWAFYLSPDQFARAEAIRQAVNSWVLHSGAFDSVADFASAVADPANPHELNPAYDSGDHLHPNDAGYRAIAATIDTGAL